MADKLTTDALQDLFKRMERLEGKANIKSEHCDAELHIRTDIDDEEKKPERK